LNRLGVFGDGLNFLKKHKLAGDGCQDKMISGRRNQLTLFVGSGVSGPGGLAKQITGNFP
jgi:hypothetical protein